MRPYPLSAISYPLLADRPHHDVYLHLVVQHPRHGAPLVPEHAEVAAADRERRLEAGELSDLRQLAHAEECRAEVDVPGDAVDRQVSADDAVLHGRAVELERRVAL